MCCCCCPNIHRHQVHLISYGCVSFCLITTGLVFTVFAIFQKDSQIGKVWLAGPTTMVVGLVLCGKVVIDWGPAMAHAREDSIDWRLNHGLLPDARMNSILLQDHFYKNPIVYNRNIENGRLKNVNDDIESRQSIRRSSWGSAADCIVFSHRERARHSESSVLMREMGSANQSALRTGPRSAENLAHNQHQQQSRAEMEMFTMVVGAASRCQCGPDTKRIDSQTSDSLYGAINSSYASSTKAHFSAGGGGNLYQGETFVLNDRNYLI